MLKASLAGLAGLSLPGLLRGRAEAAEAGRPIAGNKARHPALDGRRAQPHRHLGPQARPAAPEPRAVRRHRHEAAGRPALRAPAEAGGDARPVHAHPLGRCPAQQPRAEHGLPDRQPATPSRASTPRATCTRPSARSSPSITGRTTRHAALRRFMTSRIAPRLRRLPGQAVRPVPRQPGGQAARSTPTSASTPAGSPRPTSSSCPPGSDPRAARATAGRCWRDFDRLRRRARSTGRDGGDGPLRPAGGRAAGRPAGPRRLRPVDASRTPSATATASTSGASRRCWPGGWSRRAWRS